MSKLVAAGTAAVGGTATAVGGSYLLQNGTGAGSVTDSTSLGATNSSTPISADLSEFESLDKFKEKKGGNCGKYFGDLNLNGSSGTLIDGTTHKIEANHFNGSEDAQSCLVVNWERTDATAPDNKWKGYFRWIWSFVKGDKGFIAFTTTKLSATEKQLDLDGGIYFLNKSGKDWSIDKYKTLTDKKIDSDTFATAFSKPGDSLTGFTGKDSWGFMSSANDLNKVCKKDEESSCTQSTDKKKVFKGSWTWTKSNESAATETLIKWCKDFDGFFSSMYTSGEIALNGNLTSLSGAWKKEVLEDPSSIVK